MEEQEQFNSRQGLTLTEILVAVVIASVSFMAILMLCTQTIQALRLAREESRAMEAGKFELERLRTYSWVYLIHISSNEFPVSSADNWALTNLLKSTCLVNITPYPTSDTNGNMRAASVSVAWESYNGSRQTSVLTTVIGEKGMQTGGHP